MHGIPHELYRAEQVRELDRLAIETFAIPGLTLMTRAGRAAFGYLRRRWPEARRIAVFCGNGNNGGDGFVVARLAHEEGLSARVVQVGDAARIKGTAAEAAEAAWAAGVPRQAFGAGTALEDCDVVVDAMLGTGIEGEVTGGFRDAIETINGSGLPVLAIDIPSGLHADLGTELGMSVGAAATITFIGLKQGLFTGRGPGRAGEVIFDGLGVPAEVYDAVCPSARRIDAGCFRDVLRPRDRDAHKGEFGHVLVVGGDEGTAGAVRMAAEAAARVGAGLVSVATRRTTAAVAGIGRPEIMCHGVEAGAELKPLLEGATIVAVGPGLGKGRWGREMLDTLLEARLPLVVDADALNLLAVEPARRENWILTPHPGEAGRLLECSAEDVQADRFTAAAGVRASYGGVCVLKGAGTVVVSEAARPAVCSAGNPGMAGGGMGDVLTGVIAGLAAQGTGFETAAEAGVALHAAAADRAATDGERGMLATDLFPHLRWLANP